MCSNTTLSRGTRSTHPREDPVDEDVLAVEHVDLRFGDLAVHLQHQAVLGHRLERAPDLVDRGDTRIGMRRRAGRVQLGADARSRWPAPGRSPRPTWCRSGTASSAARTAPPRAPLPGCGIDRPPAPRSSSSAASGSASPARGRTGAAVQRDHGGELRAVAQVHVPVVGTPQRQGVGSRPGQVRACSWWVSAALSPSRCTA